MATHSSIFSWRIPWTEEPGGLQTWGRKSQTQRLGPYWCCFLTEMEHVPHCIDMSGRSECCWLWENHLSVSGGENVWGGRGRKYLVWTWSSGILRFWCSQSLTFPWINVKSLKFCLGIETFSLPWMTSWLFFKNCFCYFGLWDSHPFSMPGDPITAPSRFPEVYSFVWDFTVSEVWPQQHQPLLLREESTWFNGPCFVDLVTFPTSVYIKLLRNGKCKKTQKSPWSPLS